MKMKPTMLHPFPQKISEKRVKIMNPLYSVKMLKPEVNYFRADFAMFQTEAVGPKV